MHHDDAFGTPPNLEEAFQQSASAHAWRRRQLLGLITVVAIAVLVTVGNWARVTVQFFPSVSHYTVTVVSNVSSATILVHFADKHVALPLATPIQFAETAQPYRVMLIAQAPPFTAQSCFFTVPLATNDTCHDFNGQVLLDPHHPLVSALPLSVGFRFALRDLPADQHAPIMQMVAAQLRQTTPQFILAVGTHYPVGVIFKSSQIVEEPLIASLTTQPGKPSLIPDPTCLDLCAPDMFAAPSALPLEMWQVQTYVQQQWQFLRMRDNQFIGGTDENLIPHTITFTLLYEAPSGRWIFATSAMVSLVNVVEGPLCQDGQVFLESLFFAAGTDLTSYDAHPTLADHHLAGCLFHVHSLRQAPTADFLWRLGQLYAANVPAQQTEPSLPVVSSADLAAFANAG